jgi:hypothetical protein
MVEPIRASNSTATKADSRRLPKLPKEVGVRDADEDWDISDLFSDLFWTKEVAKEFLTR